MRRCEKSTLCSSLINNASFTLSFLLRVCGWSFALLIALRLILGTEDDEVVVGPAAAASPAAEHPEEQVCAYRSFCPVLLLHNILHHRFQQFLAT